MFGDDPLEYVPKLLQVAVKDFGERPTDKEAVVRDSDIERSNGIIYNPMTIFRKIERGAPSPGSTKRIYEGFFENGRLARVVSVITKYSPGSFVNVLIGEFGIEWVMRGEIALFHSTEEQAKSLLEDLTRNPERYFEYQAKKGL